MELIGNVERKNVILIDDMVDTAGTLCSAADLLKERGAISIRAICTHALLSGNAYERIEMSELKDIVLKQKFTKGEGSLKKLRNLIKYILKNFLKHN